MFALPLAGVCMRKMAIVVVLTLASAALCAADPFDFRLNSMAAGITFQNVPGTLQLAIGFGACGLQPGRTYEVCTTGDGSSIVFGDGTYGVTPNNGMNQIHATYSSGGGTDGNVTSGDSLGFFLNFSGQELNGSLTDFRFTPVCHPLCDFLTLQATASVQGISDPQFDVSGLIELPKGTDLLSLLNSGTPGQLTGSIVPEPSSIAFIFSACLPFMIRMIRVKSSKQSFI